jgi:hypothetical protein
MVSTPTVSNFGSNETTQILGSIIFSIKLFTFNLLFFQIKIFKKNFDKFHFFKRFSPSYFLKARDTATLEIKISK